MASRVGFKLDFGEDNTGWQFKYLTRGGGYYFNVGCSDLVVSGVIALRQFSDIETFDATARDEKRRNAGRRPDRAGDRYNARKNWCATVRRGSRGSRRHDLGLWHEQELRNMYVRTGQPGLWFIAGGLAQCRIARKFCAEIKAIEEGCCRRSRADSLSSLLPLWEKVARTKSVPDEGSCPSIDRTLTVSISLR